MIHLLATRYPKHIAYGFFLLFLSGILPAHAHYQHTQYRTTYNTDRFFPGKRFDPESKRGDTKNENFKDKTGNQVNTAIGKDDFKPDNGGPTQPEMASFKPVGANDLVNLFTGDFSYNIPLLDVGGYPVNIFYDGNVSPEQDASWVGLGWNINPGSVSRNMRGVPDDFDGTDELVQVQDMKPNITWGGSLGYDMELVGTKEFTKLFTGSAGLSLGMSFNNYLGPALDLGIKGGTNFKIASNSSSEKSYSIGGSLAVNISSRNGLTLSPNMSLTASGFTKSKNLSFGAGLSTSYNSRSGIKQIQISEQMAYNIKSQIPKLSNFTNALISKYASALSNLTFSTPITFSKPSYVPALRLPITNTAWSGHFQLGDALFGIYGSAETEVYKQTSEIAETDRVQTKPLVGYLYSQNAKLNTATVMDFTRFNDNEVMPNTPIISAPQYAYDVFSIQGEGTGGTIRAYRNDFGYVRDNITLSKDKSKGFGGDIGIPGHVGANFNTVSTPSSIGEWGNGNGLRALQGFTTPNGTVENVYFRNPGENSVINPFNLEQVGGTDLVRFKLGGTNANPILQPSLEVFPKTGPVATKAYAGSIINERTKRTQVSTFLTAGEAKEIGLDREIKSYDPVAILTAQKNLAYQSFPRLDEADHQKHHISQITVTEGDGKRYVYGIPVYNHLQKDFTFTVTNEGNIADLVNLEIADKNAIGASKATSDARKDGYLQITTTPAYAHSFLLSGLLSSDYVDINDDGITDDDLGQAVKFNYTRLMDGSQPLYHKWKTPMTNEPIEMANFNAGHLSETKDDKGIISYGEREAWYLHSIESKTMIALFTTEDRKDGKGVTNALGTIETGDNSQKRLKKIDLYSKSDLKKNGLGNAKPIKTVWFTYTYSLCANAPGNNAIAEPGETDNVNESKGKLTLQSIYFTYNGKVRQNKNRYLFSYTKNNGEGNPAYQQASSDRWGTYKPYTQNPVATSGRLKNALYPYSIQNPDQANQNASAWSLKRILLPSGGQIEVDYESDDYAFVQNRQATSMMQILGFGGSPNEINSNKLYKVGFTSITDNLYVKIKVPESCANQTEVKEKYLKGIEQLAFKLAVKMPDGYEHIPVYATVEPGGYGLTSTPNTIWLKLNKVNDLSPLTLSSLDYLREQLPGQAFPGYDLSEGTTLEKAGTMLVQMLSELNGAFKDPISWFRSKGLAQTVDLGACFVRLNNPKGHKFGGGNRVHAVRLKDNWNAMTGQYGATYGQIYDYTTKENFAGSERLISSGVASYEPSIGGEENPFQSIVQVQDKIPLGPTSYGAIEMPVLDAFFPAPVVGYRKVTVQALKKSTTVTQGKKSRSGIGRQVTEFYTAKDFPVYYSHTDLDPTADKSEHKSSLLNFFYKSAFDSRALSQGFLVATNDMHGKMKSQSSYAEGDDKTRINYTENFYRNTGVKGLDEKFDFVYAAEGGKVREGNMGIDVELMTDTREFSVKSRSLEIQGQLDLFPVVLPFWLPFIWPVIGGSENTYRAVTTTKVINYHSVLDRVLVIDKGSEVSTENLLYDSETGAVVVNRTKNEFNKFVYTTTYPAWWAYSGMGLSYKNIDAVFKSVNFLDGKVVNNSGLIAASESGDELYISSPGSNPSGCGAEIVSSDTIRKIWAFNKHKTNTALTDPSPDFIFLDAKGKPYTRSGVDVRIVRSGHRNFLGQTVAGIVTMTDPIDRSISNNYVLTVKPDAKVVNASAVEFKEKWQTDNDVIKRVKLITPSITELVINGDFSGGSAGFNSDYTNFAASHFGGHEGMYTVATNPSSWNTNGFISCSGHTNGNINNDKMMIVNGSTAGGSARVWWQTVTVLPNTNYVFSGWGQNISSPNPPSPSKLQLQINDNSIGSFFQLNNSTCFWKKFLVIWNSGNSTTAKLAVIDLNQAAVGNDFAIDDLSFKIEYCGIPLIEVEDCDGELEKSINPYLKGLVGNFVADKSYVFYGSRQNADPALQTNLKTDGFLEAFSPYWNFNPINNLAPPASGGKWVWNNEITRMNSKGQELETKNALNIYSSLQYGYHKSMPVAIASNSAYGESFYAGMEDKSFEESISNVLAPLCPKPHIDFEAVLNNNAHTGNYVVNVNAASTLSKVIPVKTQPAQAYSLTFASETKTSLYDMGGSFNVNTITPVSANINGSYAALSEGGNRFKVQGVSSQGYFNYNLQTTQYIEVPTRGLYDLELYYQQVSGPTYVAAEPERLFASFEIYNQSGQSITASSSTHQATTQNDVQGFYRNSYDLCPGIYTISVTGHAFHGNPATPSNIQTEDWFSIKCTNASLPMYKTLNTQNGCIITKPLSGNDDMLNPVFAVPLSKKMLFAGWVKEGCANSSSTPCNTTSYTNSEVRLEFNGGSNQVVSIKPSGPVIEGWQRCEGIFTAPSGATEMTMKFINTAGQPLYLDDIRMHPFNANMKSFVYDPITLRLMAELDANNYATFYEYDEEGTLVRTKVETKQGIKTVNETRSFKQRSIVNFQQ